MVKLDCSHVSGDLSLDTKMKPNLVLWTKGGCEPTYCKSDSNSQRRKEIALCNITEANFFR